MCISNLFNKDVKGKTTESVSDKPTAWREIPPFESIGLDTFADVVLIKGEQERLLIVSGQDIGQAIKTEVEGKRLWISTTNDGTETLPETTLI